MQLDATDKGAFSLIGGGDSVAAVNKYSLSTELVMFHGRWCYVRIFRRKSSAWNTNYLKLTSLICLSNTNIIFNNAKN